MSASAPSTFSTISTAATMSVWVAVSWSRARPASSSARIASAETRSATTAKPRPASPARPASTAAFIARTRVWKAILSRPSITLSMPLALSATRSSPAPPRRRSRGRRSRWRSPVGALDRAAGGCAVALRRPSIWVTAAEVSSRLAALASVRRARSSDAWAISPEPVRIVAALSHHRADQVAQLGHRVVEIGLHRFIVAGKSRVISAVRLPLASLRRAGLERLDHHLLLGIGDRAWPRRRPPWRPRPRGTPEPRAPCRPVRRRDRELVHRVIPSRDTAGRCRSRSIARLTTSMVMSGARRKITFASAISFALTSSAAIAPWCRDHRACSVILVAVAAADRAPLWRFRVVVISRRCRDPSA
jgi:hypothetical protein